MSREDLENKTWLDAITFRIMLSVSLFLIIILAAFGFTYTQQLLSKYATEIAHKRVDASASDNTISSLQKVQQTIEQNEGLISKINTLRADSTFPEFMIVDQMKAIAKRNNIRINSYDFGSSAGGEGSDMPAAAVTPPSPSAAGGGLPTAMPAKSGTVSLTLNFGSIRSYRDYLQFLYDIEQNVPKIRIRSVGVSGGSSTSVTDAVAPNANNSSPEQQSQKSSTDGFSVDPLVVEMYVK